MEECNNDQPTGSDRGAKRRRVAIDNKADESKKMGRREDDEVSNVV